MLYVSNEVKSDGKSTLFMFLYQGFYIQADWIPQHWHHVCFSFKSSTSQVVLVSNGRILMEKVLESPQPGESTKVPPECLTNLNIMRGSGSADDSMFGKMTDVNIWGRALTKRDMIQWTKCELEDQGDIISWIKAKWVTSGLSNEQPLQMHQYSQNVIIILKCFTQLF